MNKNKIGVKTTETAVGFFLVLCIAVGIVLHVFPYSFHKSLWLDEAMLASSICNRSFAELVSSPLDWGQSSAIGWLFIEKAVTSVFGTSETALRAWSLVSSFGCMLLVYALLRGKVKHNYALFITAIFSLTDGFIYYGYEVKPYMFDNLLCLLTLYVWQGYQDHKISRWLMLVLYSAIIWFSFPAVFFVAACMVIECLCLLKKMIEEKKKEHFLSLCSCSVVLISFLLNYILWISQASENAGEKGYWDLLRFPLIPTSMADIALIGKMAGHFFAYYPVYIAAVFAVLAMVHMAMCWRMKADSSHLILPFWVSFALLLVASYCGFYPIQDRLVQIYQLVLIVLAGFGGNGICVGIMKKENAKSKIHWPGLIYYGVLTVCLALTGLSGCQNLRGWHVYMYGSEVVESVRFLQNRLSERDVVYVYSAAIPVYEYEMGKTDYSSWTDMPDQPSRIGDTIYGQPLISYFFQEPYSYDFEENVQNVEEDAKMIIENDSVYIFTSHGGTGVEWLLEEIMKYGIVETVDDSYSTPLYHFIKD